MLLFLYLCFFTSIAFAETYKILAFGDSLTAGYGLPSGQAFPDKLEVKLKAAGYDVKVINAGVSGETTSGGLNRLDWTLKHDPDLVLLGLGANDALRFLPPDLAYQNLEAMIQNIQSRGIQILLLGMYAPRNSDPRYIQKFDRIFPTLAQKYNIPLYPFLLEGVALNPAYNLADGVHPNNQGTEIIANNLFPYMIHIIKHSKK